MPGLFIKQPDCLLSYPVLCNILALSDQNNVIPLYNSLQNFRNTSIFPLFSSSCSLSSLPPPIEYIYYITQIGYYQPILGINAIIKSKKEKLWNLRIF